MAVWGAPVAREDDAERAVRAGFELVDEVQSLGSGIQARAGVLTGAAAAKIELFTANWTIGATPFVWVKTADEILAKAVRKRPANFDSRH
jgi:hypothetical protein